MSPAPLVQGKLNKEIGIIVGIFTIGHRFCQHAALIDKIFTYLSVTVRPASR